MPSRFGFMTEQEKRDANLATAEAVVELARVREKRNRDEAEAIFEGIQETVGLILADFVAARELVNPEFTQDSLSITVTAMNMASNPPQRVTIKVHAPLGRGYALFLCRPTNWNNLFGRGDLLHLAQVLADNCNIETHITVTTTETKQELTQAGTYIAIPPGERDIQSFLPTKIRVQVTEPYNR